MNYWFNEDKTIRLYNGDCLDIMNKFVEKNIKVDCVVTDPPYKLTSGGNTGNTGGIFKTDLGKKGKLFSNNNLNPKDFLNYCMILLQKMLMYILW